MRPKLVVANWKMNTTLADAHTLAIGVRNGAEHLDHVEIVLCPPVIWLTELAHHGLAPRQLSHLKLGAQNLYFEKEGPFTGEISPTMIKEVAEFVIIGHSERIRYFQETSGLINQKLQAALENHLIPILCVGEKEKDEHSYRRVTSLLSLLIQDLMPGALERVVVAYEPIWAVGTKNPATPEYAQTMIHALREMLSPKTLILYGGSVDQKIAGGFLSQPDIDGFLVGGASLSLKSFLGICELANDLSIPQKQ